MAGEGERGAIGDGERPAGPRCEIAGKPELAAGQVVGVDGQDFDGEFVFKVTDVEGAELEVAAHEHEGLPAAARVSKTSTW